MICRDVEDNCGAQPHADRSFPPVIIPVVPRFIPTVPLNLGQGINSLTADMIPVEASRIGL
jgi:hypothetical protein